MTAASDITMATYIFVNSTIAPCNTSIPDVAHSTPVSSTAARTLADSILIAMAGAVLSLVTIGGNTLVTAAFVKCKRLRTLNNLFIFSLALSDISVGVFSINLYTVYVVLRRWPLGVVMCDIWLVLDYVCCQASVIHLLMISFDRYLSISRPLSYRARRTRRRIRIAIVIAWVIAFLQWAPWIVFYPFIKGERTVSDDACYVQFLYESWYPTVITAILAYYAPVAIMITVYLRIYSLMLRRAREMALLTNYSVISAAKRKISKHVQSAISRVTSSKRGQERQRRNKPVTMTQADVSKLQETREKQKFLIKEKKAAKMLSVILSAFVITWLPYHVLVIITPFCSNCVSAAWWDFSYMLCYLNSTLNPLCYALGSNEFKRVFKQIICRKSPDLSSSMADSVLQKVEQPNKGDAVVINQPRMHRLSVANEAFDLEQDEDHHGNNSNQANRRRLSSSL